jgi:hypothetical protein
MEYLKKDEKPKLLYIVTHYDTASESQGFMNGNWQLRALTA